jgi:hypothetical protein
MHPSTTLREDRDPIAVMDRHRGSRRQQERFGRARVDSDHPSPR